MRLARIVFESPMRSNRRGSELSQELYVRSCARCSKVKSLCRMRRGAPTLAWEVNEAMYSKIYIPFDGRKLAGRPAACVADRRPND